MIEIKHFNGAVLFRSETATNIREAVEEAVRERVELYGALLAHANLEGARLTSGHFNGAVFYRANLSGADLRYINAEGANFCVAKMEGARAQDADFAGAYMYQANMREVNAPRALLRGVNLSYANLNGANFDQADFSGAFLARTALHRTRIQGARFHGAALDDARLDGAILQPNLCLAGNLSVLAIGPIGSRDDMCTFYTTNKGTYVLAGCFFDTLAQFEHEVNKTHGDNVHGDDYRALITLVRGREERRLRAEQA